MLSNPSLLWRNYTFPTVPSSTLHVQERKVLSRQCNCYLLFPGFPKGFLAPFIPRHSRARVTWKGTGKSLMRRRTVALSGVINTNTAKHLTDEDLQDEREILKSHCLSSHALLVNYNSSKLSSMLMKNLMWWNLAILTAQQSLQWPLKNTSLWYHDTAVQHGHVHPTVCCTSEVDDNNWN